MDTIGQLKLQGQDSARAVDTVSYGEEIYKDYIPEKLLAFIENDLSGWSVPAPSHWEKYWFNPYKNDSALVNYFAADVDCNGDEDYAMLLYNEEERQLGIWVIFSDSSGFSADTAEVFEQINKDFPISYGISAVKPGMIADMYEGKPIGMKCAGIKMEFFEAASRIYYYDDGEFKFVQTGD